MLNFREKMLNIPLQESCSLHHNYVFSFYFPAKKSVNSSESYRKFLFEVIVKKKKSGNMKNYEKNWATYCICTQSEKVHKSILARTTIKCILKLLNNS